jgi:NAD(P)-dependent dehydrogenase (short-subunit alcohol dehydrogenase family)
MNLELSGRVAIVAAARRGLGRAVAEQFACEGANVLASLATAGVGLFVVSTFETDYLLVTQEQLASAIAALDRAGHSIHRSNQE